MVRCCLESLALNYRQAMEDLETLTGNPLQTIRIVGGGSRNHLLCQFTADACQRPVVTGPIEATALGNVLLGLHAYGDLQALADGIAQFQPESRLAARFRAWVALAAVSWCIPK